jgi:indoleamine 2,3-dioxygenase
MSSLVETLRVQPFGIDPVRGFLPASDPLVEIPDVTDPVLTKILEYGRNLPELLEEHKIRGFLDRLEVPAESSLRERSFEERTALARTLAFLASAYVHQIDDVEVSKIPKGVAVPLNYLSKSIGRRYPILSYDLYCLNNWRRIKEDGPIEVENMDTIQKFVRIRDEPWFILIHTEIESKAAPGIVALGRIQQAVLEKKRENLFDALNDVNSSLRNMTSTLKRMPEGNSPDVYAFAFRPYIQMFEGVEYEGVGELRGPQTFRGETGAQSSIIPSMDAGLGIKHARTDLTDYVADMRNYMPEGHRRFIETLYSIEAARPVREFISSLHDNELMDAYDDCLEELLRFRQKHLEFAVMYIQSKVRDESGTGGTPFMRWLAQLRDETRAAQFFR